MRVGLIGVGMWGTNIQETLRQFNNVEIITCDKEKGLAQHQDLEAMGNLDACIVATPADTHYKIALDVLDKKIPCLIEKPMVKSEVEATALVAFAAEQNTPLMVGHVFMFNPAIKAMKQEIDEGALGQVYYINTRRLKTGKLREDTDTLWNFAPHDISICNYIFGRMPDTVKCEGWAFKQAGRVDVAHMTLHYGPRRAHIHVSWLDPNKVREVTVVGSEAMAICDDTAMMDKLIIARNLEETVIEADYLRTPLFLEMEYFLDCAAKKIKPTIATGLEGLQVVSVLAAAAKSMRNNGEAILI